MPSPELGTARTTGSSPLAPLFPLSASGGLPQALVSGSVSAPQPCVLLAGDADPTDYLETHFSFIWLPEFSQRAAGNWGKNCCLRWVVVRNLGKNQTIQCFLCDTQYFYYNSHNPGEGVFWLHGCCGSCLSYRNLEVLRCIQPNVPRDGQQLLGTQNVGAGVAVAETGARPH